MALSGVFTKNIGAQWKLQGEWSATQNTGANQSTVTLKLYLIASQYGAIYSSATNGGSVTIEGVSSSFTASPALSNYQKKLLKTYSRTITHNSDGTFPDLDLAFEFDMKVTLAGTYYGNVSHSASYALNSIPRESVLSGSSSWTAGENRTTTITRYSSSFNHIVKYYVQNTSGTWILIKEIAYGTSTTSASSSFSLAQQEQIFDVIAGRVSAPCRIVVDTYSGSSFIGGNGYDGTVSAPLASYSVSPSSFYMGETFSMTIDRENSNFTHMVRLKNGSTILKTYQNVGTSLDFDTASIRSTLLALIPNSDSITLTIEVFTYYGVELVRSSRTESIIARSPGTNPNFSGTPSHYDMNATTRAITNTNGQSIISKRSNVSITIPVAMRATANDGATMKEYVATLGGKSLIRAWSSSADVVFDFGPIMSNVNQVLVIKAVDSRGNSTTISKTIPVIAYDPPGISSSAERIGGFEDATILKLSGTLSSLNIGGSNKNALVSARYRTKDAAGSAWSSYVNFATAGFPQFTATDVEVILNKVNAYHVEFSVADKLGTTTVQRTVNSGKPIIMIDDRLESVGFGDYPSKANEVMMNMILRFAANKYGGAGGIDMNNSDIFGANSMFFKDYLNGDGEGFHFPKSTWSDPGDGSVPVPADRDTLRVSDGVLFLNSKPVGQSNQRVIWEGVVYPNATANLALSTPISNFANGIILFWSQYVVGTGESNFGWQTTVILKEFLGFPGTAFRCPLMDVNLAMIEKYLYITDTSITANSSASTGNNRNMVLRYIVGF